MNAIIHQKLKTLEHEHDVRILYACESGSRAWGFASPDSDYDVRFIYAHRKEHYLSVDDQRDVIELPINDVLDINGWELRKALKLLRKSNAPLYEWLQSPIMYQADAGFLQEIKGLLPEYFSQRAAMHHYLSMARGVFENELSGPEVRLKKYFYALRPILACRWIADQATVPPMELGQLRVSLSVELNDMVDDLLRQKAVENERSMIRRLDLLDNFIATQIAYCEEVVPKRTSPDMDNKLLNKTFRKFVI